MKQHLHRLLVATRWPVARAYSVTGTFPPHAILYQKRHPSRLHLSTGAKITRPPSQPASPSDLERFGQYHSYAKFKQRQQQVLAEEEKALPRNMKKAVADDPGNAGEVLEKYISRGDVNPALIRLCLRQAKRHFSTIPKHRLHTAIQKQKVHLGRTVLEYLWRDATLWLQIASRDDHFFDDLCWIAIRENLEPLLRKWLEVELPLPDQVGDIGKEHHAWRGALLRSIITSHLEQNKGGSADSAIRCLLEVVQRKDAVKASYKAEAHKGNPPAAPQVRFLSASPAVLKLTACLRTPHWPKTSSALFNRLVHFTRRYKGKKDERQMMWVEAQMLLHHPTKPDATKAIALFREFLGPDDSSPRKIVQELSLRHRQSLNHQLRRSLYLVSSAGDTNTMAWLERVLEQYFPDRVIKPWLQSDLSGQDPRQDRS